MNAIWLLDSVPILRPTHLEEALRFLSESVASQKRPMILAGGTDVMVGMEAGTVRPESVLDIWSLAELRQIADHPTHVSFGALATYTDIINHPSTPNVLSEASKTIGAAQIQNRGTLGGNVGNASPAGDTLPVLLALNATVQVTSLRGSRDIPFSEFYNGYRKTTMAPNELITRINVPKIPANVFTYFRKVGTRRAQAISKVVFCGAADKATTISNIRLAFGSIAPTVIRLKDTEQFLEGKPLSDSLIEQANESASRESAPIDDIRSTADYRKWVVGNLIAQFLRDLHSSVVDAPT